MTRITKPMRGQRATKKLDLTDMRAVLRDRRMWSAIGTVFEPEGDQHWEVVTGDDGSSVDIVIEVLLHPSEQPVTCRLRAGMWEVPDVDDEVIVLIPEGETDFMPIVIGRLSSNVVPTVQGPEPGKLVIVNGQVLVHDGSGGAVALALKSDVDDLAEWSTTHFHPASSGTTSPSTDPVPVAAGTTVLLGK